MALFSFQRRCGIVVVLQFLAQWIGLLSILPALTTVRQVHAVANVPIAEPDIQFILLPKTHRIIPQANGVELLHCLVSIKDEIVYSVSDFEYPFHVWLRNNEPIVAPRKNEFQIFENGTLKILAGEKATGSYRCLVNGTEIEAGILLSNETVVQSAVLKRIPTDLNRTAFIGEPTVLECPILSVPRANITWFFGNKNTNSIGNRFLSLENGGLLIKNTSASDQGKFKCVARNNYASKHRQIVWSVTVKESSDAPHKTQNSLEALQNDTVFVEEGKPFQLYCISSEGSVNWWFTSRSYGNHSVLLKNDSVELQVNQASIEENDGWYKCATKSDYKIFNVIIATRPKILVPLESWESSVSAQASFNCHVVGNPTPTITWYRNGVRLENDLRVHFTSHTLYINSIDLDEGIYQCFAKNPMGEAFSSGRLVLRRKDDLPTLPKRPQDISCYPVNHETVFVTFTAKSPLSFITPHIVTRDPFNWKAVMPVPLTSSSKFTMAHVPVFKPFTLFLRGMVPTSTQKTENGELHTFDTSLLSEGANCSTQGMRINTVFLQAGVYIFWTPMDVVKAKYFRIQFWNNNSKNALLFGDTIVGTTHSIDLQRTTKDDINRRLFKMPVLDKRDSVDEMRELRAKRSIDGGTSAPSGKQNFKNAKKGAKQDKDTMESGSNITEIRVAGNVTGVLIPNTETIDVRVLIVTAENENMNQDLRYVEWDSISLQPSAPQSHNFFFRIANVESRSITISWNPIQSMSCIKVCYFINMLEAKIRQSNQNICQDIHEIDRYFTIGKLLPSTIYQMSFIDCETSRQFGTVDVKTLPDAPSAVTNHKVIKSDGFLLSWDPPINPNGEILFYNIKWTVRNATYSTNVTATDNNSFKFPNVTEDDKINITICAIGTSGVGYPIYMNFSSSITSSFDKGARSFSDPFLGIIVGIVLSFLCILVFICIFLKHRKRFKTRGCSQGSTASPADSHCQQTSASNIELREMQTLIPKANSLHIVSDAMNELPRNGIYYSENDEETETAENVREISRSICTSTPKNTGKSEKYYPLSEKLIQDSGAIGNESQMTPLISPSSPSVIVPVMTSRITQDNPTSIVTPAEPTATTIPDSTTSQLLDKISSSPNFYISKLHSNGNSTKLQNGSIKTTLPPNKHSIEAATSEPKFLKVNGSLKTANSTQYSIDPNSNTSTTLDNSRHKLLDSKLDSRSTISQLNDTTKNHRNNNHRPPSHNQQQLALSHPHKQPNNHHSNVTLNDSADTTTTTIDLNDSIRNLNSSSSSCNPLLKSAAWNYRRPIVEPNG